MKEVLTFVQKATLRDKDYGTKPKQITRKLIEMLPNISDVLLKKYEAMIQDATSQADLNNIVDQAKKEVLEGDSEKYRHEIDNLSVTGLTMMAEADEIYQKHKNLLHSHYKDSIGTYTNLFTNRGGVTPWVGAEGLKDAQEAFRKAKVLLANLKALQEQIEKTQKKPVAKGTYDVKYVDTEGEEVAKSRHFEGEEGTAFVTSAKEVAGYKLVRTEGDVLNVFTAGAQVRTYVYEKVKPEVKPDVKPEAKP
ncbi:TPA: MucBP domain-containing protein, partial [Streptococcus agalactiae]|nr:MucBP domain-containing protein [Streptococcus agalactiae]